MRLIRPTSVIEPWVWHKDVFTTEELDFLEKKALEACQTPLVGTGQGQVAPDIRRCGLSWLEDNPENAWVYERLGAIIADSNEKFFGFDLTGFGEAIQLAKYDAAEADTYTWHTDAGGGGVSRKLSLCMQLTDPSKYEGGRLELFHGSEPSILPKDRGFIAIFPSYTLHRVTPVYSGTRASLVSWITGPRLR